MKQLFILFFILACLVLVPFLIWGDQIEAKMSLTGTVDLLRSQGRWAWAIGIGLLIIDLFLPILGTVVMSALGLIYGGLVGGLFASIGSMSAGILAYGLSRAMGRSVAEKITGKQGLAKGETLFAGELGSWMIALSRWMPILPEVMACMAGLSRMPFRRFVVALACGSIPLGFTFAFIGAAGVDRPILTLVLSAGLPPVIWLLLRPVFYREKNCK